MSLAELKKALKEKTITFGTDKTLKMLRNGTAKKVFLASNCTQETKETIAHYAKLNSVEIVIMKQPSDEMGLTCKKPFSIAVLCY
ncbi:MAG: ribosomal L7Ae/L30e/S12e/Gadd45 family protein [Nanoarchaeota archaeon]|nr:ribosomal L7Ae/L30e/S12e/Gadd45 family protein [Nanoarchaeota archaeon]MCG2717868.1 ribosomal L7Ae/L30e/S12e/Gadd45 family protein [Nanoarchaeota archaeon]